MDQIKWQFVSYVTINILININMLNLLYLKMLEVVTTEIYIYACIYVHIDLTLSYLYLFLNDDDSGLMKPVKTSTFTRVHRWLATETPANRISNKDSSHDFVLLY